MHKFQLRGQLTLGEREESVSDISWGSQLTHYQTMLVELGLELEGRRQRRGSLSDSS
jgi:hypothetical protein